ncbi:hypothetical protein THICB1_150116 [Thiomonas arsenitoxydans]|uniref:Tyr recombinase domain-containing protein n=1 Tax=Thiomonas arsenitoxydans (strain DSM 22701 / CIP 110005 / 3As) TaxID=426114 RepID=A0ABP1Z1J3_THIA3|nr:hypothetical protein ACO3_170004 [Thiomonas arsenitoxydans]CQR29251.1 hypothetical protein ACO7_150005 [Thiomonas arsenitoxydans]CQR30765.1 hypothetical protein THICB1_150116 [Thiomonas arsenitoxydans]CQR33203.1 hypothetical protein THICB6_180002 [Thiomonas arsenitoxydans]
MQFEITAATREAVGTWIKMAELRGNDYIFPSRMHASPHLGTRQYARIVHGWVEEIGLDGHAYGTHSMRRLIYRKTKNLRAVQLLLGHTKLKSTVRYLGIEVKMLSTSRSRPKSDTFFGPTSPSDGVGHDRPFARDSFRASSAEWAGH